ncbi:MAG: hypothetical protein HFE72_12335 [Emergencia sp.]|nr:hypothetical protein [Emergencia sp.]
MIVKVYKASVVPLSNLSHTDRSNRLLMEREDVKRIEYNASIDLLTVCSKTGEEKFNCSDCCFEVVDREHKDV